MARTALLLAAAFIAVGCAQGPAPQTNGAPGQEAAKEPPAIGAHAEGGTVIDRADHVATHLADAAELLAEIQGRSEGPEQRALTDISKRTDTALQLVQTIYDLSESLQKKSGQLEDSAEWKEAADLLTWAALDAFDAHAATLALIEQHPSYQPLATALEQAWNELGEIVVAMGGSVEYY